MGRLGLWGFDGGAGGIEGRWIRLTGMIWTTTAARGSTFGILTLSGELDWCPVGRLVAAPGKGAPWPAAAVGIIRAS